MKHCHVIKSLNLYNCSNITDLGIEAAGLSCPELEFLGAFGLEHITKDIVTHMLETMPGLKLDVGGCPNLRSPEPAPQKPLEEVIDV